MKTEGTMNRFKKIGVLVALLLVFASGTMAQQVLKGKVLSPYDNDPVSNAYISLDKQESTAQSDESGEFSLEVDQLTGKLKVWAPGYQEKIIPVLGRDYLEVVLIPQTADYYEIPVKNAPNGAMEAEVMQAQRFKPSALYVEDVLQGAFPGLNVINKSGMPGEGAYVNLRGIRSLTANNGPLIVINGMPYLPDMNNSPIIEGYSSSIFNVISVNDIDQIRLVKGSEASRFGSLGSNGVLLIETSTPNDMETVIEFSGQYGVAFNNKELPVLGVDDFKSYIGDVGLTRYEDMGDMLDLFPFLRDDPDYYYNFLYNNQTNWQELINRSSFVTSNHLRVKGGDAIAQYDLSVGASNQGGTMDKTNFTRYTTRLNAQIALSQKFQLVTSMGLTYGNSKLHEQILSDASNPLMAALYKAPILSPFKKDEYNNQLPAYDAVRQFGVSNPLSVMNDTKMESDNFDVFLNTGLNYQANDNTLIQGVFGYYSSYKRQTSFIPGRSSQTIVPLEEGVALNTARAGTGKVSNLFYKVNADYSAALAGNQLDAGIGFQGLMTRHEFDGGFGRNTSSDFYTTLSYVEADGRYFSGYYNSWNWMSLFGYAHYQFADQFMASLNVAADGASSTGKDTGRVGVFPGLELTWKAKNSPWLMDNQKVDKLDVHLGYGLTGNSQYPTGLSQQYFSSQAYRQLAGIVNGNVANTQLTWERNQTVDAGIDGSFFNKRLMASIGVYQTISSDVIYPKGISSVYGIQSMYVNGAKLENKGIEAGLQFSLVDQRDWNWSIGGTINKNKNVISEMAAENGQLVREMPGDWALVSAEGQNPYSFYGYVSNGIISTQEEADVLNLVDYKGDQFNAGDVAFEDLNGDGVINDQDRTIIGNASPDFFGSFFTQVRYHKLSLSAQFTFSSGNQIYNGVRREMESLSDFRNQSLAADRRWQTDGQVTDIPKAMYGDPMGNSRFSDRWIEDGSYLRLNNVTLSYQLGRLSFIEGGEVYIAGENLLTLTDYLGLDPVLSYSYQPHMQGVDFGSLPLPTTVKFGFNLQF
ncbi:SusC/RagA family TonB-linked outer membrane protein [Echinicola sp. CAU 1574]|uniref:SusC/RagA family TonB-linked outer membrane protein n=2 Tax=Echinicola arenosa TaxID=2774144 RepID=A0ABR9APH4_9BACT|nr:SusC/RagA family TonB-linked outer membrane protein [Echinicola arenosa]